MGLVTEAMLSPWTASCSPNPLEEREVSLCSFPLLIKFWIRPELSPGPSWSFRDQGSWDQKAQGAAWLRHGQVAWKVMTGLLAGSRLSSPGSWLHP